jgi:hypothetical protein
MGFRLTAVQIWSVDNADPGYPVDIRIRIGTSSSRGNWGRSVGVHIPPSSQPSSGGNSREKGARSGDNR